MSMYNIRILYKGLFTKQISIRITKTKYQSQVLSMIVDDPWYVPNSLIRKDLSCPTVKKEIRRYNSHYGDRIRTHPNHLAVNLHQLPDNRRIRRFLPTDLPDRF
jgi:hypothetical protein